MGRHGFDSSDRSRPGFPSVIARGCTCLFALAFVVACGGDEAGLEQSREAAAARSGLLSQGDLSDGCGLGVDGSLVCWGLGGPPEDLPAGPFAAVALGLTHGCGLRPGGVLECWGVDGRFGFVGGGDAEAPGGVFAAVATGGGRSCGLRPDGAAECWGGDWELEDGVVATGGEVAAPGGVFEAVSVGYAHACGLRPGGAVECWGTNWFGQTDVPAGSFVALDAGVSHTCGLRADGSAACWGADSMDAGEAGSWGFHLGGSEQTYEDFYREGIYSDVESLPRSVTLMTIADAVPDAALIGVMVERAARWEPPGGPFVALSAGAGFTCGLRADAEVECWGYVADEEPRIPLAVYAEVAGDSIRETRAAKQAEVEARRGDKDDEDLNSAERAVARVDTLELNAYATMLAYLELVDPPAGPFLAIDAGVLRVCGLRPGGTIDCWGATRDADDGPPPGPFATEAPEVRTDPADLSEQRTTTTLAADAAGSEELPEVVQVPLGARRVGDRGSGCWPVWGPVWGPGGRVELFASLFAPGSTVSWVVEGGTVPRRDGSVGAVLLPPVELSATTADSEGKVSLIWALPEAPAAAEDPTPRWYYVGADGESARAGIRLEARLVDPLVVYPGVQPCAVDDAAVTESGVPVRIDVLANDVAPTGGVLDPASVEVESAFGGEFAVDPVDGSLTFTPDPGFVGTTSAYYMALDSWNVGAIGEVSVTVNAG